MGLLIWRGCMSFAAAVCVGTILVIIVSYVIADEVGCVNGQCSIVTYISQIFALFFIYGYLFVILFLAALVPFLVIYLLLVRFNAAKPMPFAILGAAVSAFFLAIGRFAEEVPFSAPVWDVFRANLMSPAGISVLVIGLLSGLSAWAAHWYMRGSVNG